MFLMYRVELKDKLGLYIEKLQTLFLMYRVELKVPCKWVNLFLGLVPNVPYGVESPEAGEPEETKIWFLMYRMELKACKLQPLNLISESS